jgi:hypothetical protein
MKTIKRMLIAGMLTATLTAVANEDKIVTSNADNVTITKNDGQVQISILNRNRTTFTLYIYNPNGELVFKDVLGNDTSLGKEFDFSSAIKGKYVFTLVNADGEKTFHTVKAGSVR